MDKNLICIICPNGCKIHANIDSAGQLIVSGNKCKRGETFAGTELTDPTRSITTTVKTIFEDTPFLPVRTDGEVPKAMIKKVINELQNFILKDKVKCGDVIIENVAGTKCSVIATLDL